VRRLVVVGTAMLIVIAAYAGPAVASAPDRPNLTSLTVSAAHPQVGDTVTVDAKAFDHGGVEYFVYFFTPRLTALTCVGTPSGPSPDTPSCEYNAATTTTRFMTHTILSFEPDVPGDTEVTACVVTPDQHPEDGDCRTVVVTAT